MAPSSNLLLDLYSCPTEPGRWQSALDAVCREVRARSAVVQILRPNGQVMEQAWIARDTQSTRNAELHDRIVNNASNPRLNMAIGRPPSGAVVLRDRERFAPGCPHLAALRKRLRAIGFGQAVSVGVERGNGDSVVLIAHRAGEDDAEFTADEEQLLLELAPFVEKAVDLSARVGLEECPPGSFREILDALSLGVLICDAERRLCWANRTGEELLARTPHLTVRHGVLRARAARIDRELASLIAGTVCGQGAAAARPLVMGALDEDELQLMPVGTTCGDRSVAGPSAAGHVAFVLAEPRRAPRLSPDAVGRLLGLSPAEARVATALCAGRSLKEYALSRGIAEGSARNQLKQALSKTGAGRQSELVRQLCTSVLGQVCAPAGSSSHI